MRNEERYKTAKERSEAFYAFCDGKCDRACLAHKMDGCNITPNVLSWDPFSTKPRRNFPNSGRTPSNSKESQWHTNLV
jgi:hypothetical protein